MERQFIPNEIIYNISNNTLKIYQEDILIDELPIIGIRSLESDNIILKNNEIGLFNNVIKIGDGISTFSNLPTPNIIQTRADSSNYGLVKIGSNINVNNGIISINDSSTSEKGVVQLTDSTSSTSTTTAATPNSVKQAYDLANTVFTGATQNKDGTKGLVPAPTISDKDKYLKGDGSWNTIITDNATVSSDGFMSKEDKEKLDNIEEEANKYILPVATTNTLGGVKIGSNISIGSEDNAIYISNANVLAALNKSTDTTKFLRNDGSWAVPPDNNTTYDIATSTTSGLLSSSDKTKLDSIERNANYYILESATSETLGGVKIGSNINIDSDGVISVNTASTSRSGIVLLSDSTSSTSSTTAATSKAIKNTYDAATQVFDGSNTGRVPSVSSSDSNKYLKSDGTWSIPDNTTYNIATTSTDGLMSSSDKSKLDNIEDNANHIIIDSSVSDTSTNPVQNKIIKSYIDNKVSDLVNSAPETLDTLSELATALGSDPNFATTMATELGKKVDKVSGKQLSTNDYTTTEKNKLSGITESADAVSFTQTLKSGTKIGTITINGTDTELYSTNNDNTTYEVATSTTDGLLSKNDKVKLDNIAENANNYIHPSYTARTGKPTTNQTPSFGEAFTVSQVSSDSSGHITSLTDKTITIPNSLVSTTTNGLMSSTDKIKLNNIEENANNYSLPIASSETLGGIIIGSNITINDTNGEVSVTKDNVLNALNKGTSTTTYLRNDGSWSVPYTHPTYTAQTGKPTTNQTPSFGETFTVSQITSNTLGHVTGATDRTVTIPNTKASSSALGLVKIGSNVNVDSDGVISINTGSTSQAGILQLTNSTSSTSTTTAATPNSVKSAYDLAGTVFTGASSSADGVKGIVPAPTKGNQGKYLRADGTWNTPYTHPSYTATAGVETSNQSVTLGSSFNISQVASDASGHVSGQTTRTVTVNHPSYTATTGIETENQTPGFGSTFNISQIVSNATGHITSQTTRTVTIPNTAASTSTLGLVKIGTNINVSDGVISINTGSTSQAGILQLTDGYTSTSTTTAATSKSVKSAYDVLNSAKLNIADLIDNLKTDSNTSSVNATQSKLLQQQISLIIQSLHTLELMMIHPEDCIDVLNNITEIEPSMPMSGVLALNLQNQISKLVQVVSMLTTAALDTEIYPVLKV